jgi:dGTPase
MTHTLEVAQIARTLALTLQANEDLAEAIALAHDLGHPPFGHAGEVGLNEAMRDHGGFNHNAHSLRVVEYLEHPVPAFRGLNLTHETRSGLMVHETRYDAPSAQRPVPSLEAQIASLADRIAYNCHDLEDGIGAGFLDWSKLDRMALWKRAAEQCGVRGGTTSIHSIRRLVLDSMLDALLEAAVGESRKRLSPIHSPPTASNHAPDPLVSLPHAARQELEELESFLAAEVYRRDEIAEMDRLGQRMVRQLFEAYRADPFRLPSRYAQRVPEQGAARVICDYIAGMTDRFCQAEYARLVGD